MCIRLNLESVRKM